MIFNKKEISAKSPRIDIFKINNLIRFRHHRFQVLVKSIIRLKISQALENYFRCRNVVNSNEIISIKMSNFSIDILLNHQSIKSVTK